MRCIVNALGSFAASLLVVACNTSPAVEQAAQAAPETSAPEISSAEPKVARAPEADAPDPDAKPPGSRSKAIGIAECDAYVEKQGACIEKYPESVQAAARQFFDASIEAWEDLDVEGPARDQVAAICKAAFESAKQQGAAHGCEFD